jgi:hypothetical protein
MEACVPPRALPSSEVGRPGFDQKRAIPSAEVMIVCTLQRRQLPAETDCSTGVRSRSMTMGTTIHTVTEEREKIAGKIVL